jgi:hypothetical protein
MSSEGTGAMAAGGDWIAAGDVVLAADMVERGLVSVVEGWLKQKPSELSAIGFVMDREVEWTDDRVCPE